MNDFVRVLGKLPGEDQAVGFFLLSRAHIKGVYPFWGVIEKDVLFEVPRTYKGAQVQFCWVVDYEGKRHKLLPEDWKDLLGEGQIKQMTAPDDPRQLALLSGIGGKKE